MSERIRGPLGTERGWVRTIEQHPYDCEICGLDILPGNRMAKNGEQRHVGCHLRATFRSMSPAEQVEMVQRIHDVAFGCATCGEESDGECSECGRVFCLEHGTDHECEGPDVPR